MNRLHGGSVGWTNEKSHGEGQRNNNKKEEEEEERTGSSFVSSSSNEGHIIPQKVRRPGPAPTRFDLIHFFDTPRNFYDFSSSFARRGGYITDSRVLPGFFFFLFVVAATYPSETTHNVSMIFSSFFLKQSKSKRRRRRRFPAARPAPRRHRIAAHIVPLWARRREKLIRTI